MLRPLLKTSGALSPGRIGLRHSARAMTVTQERQLELLSSVSSSGLGRITLAREKQLNALDAELVEGVRSHLQSWLQPGSTVRAVMLDSTTPRSFCSGGDIKSARAAVLAAPYALDPPQNHHIHRVFQAEYSLVVLVSQYPIPLVSICSGIWMGLGFGIAGFGRYRVVSDTTVFAMPENSIGLWPDVGFAYKAATMPSPALGLFLGLTGVRLREASDLLYCQLATHCVLEEQLEEFKQAVQARPEQLPELLQQYSWVPPASKTGPLELLQSAIDRSCGPLLKFDQRGLTPEQALAQVQQQLRRELAALQEEAAEAGAGAGDRSSTTTPTIGNSGSSSMRGASQQQQQAAVQLLEEAVAVLSYNCPSSMAITLVHFAAVHQGYQTQHQHHQQQQQGAGWARSKGDLGAGEGLAAAAAAADGQYKPGTLEKVMRVEYNLAIRRVAHPDFLEGVRAALVDKDRKPAWSPLQVPAYPHPSAALQLAQLGSDS